jgi:hypothetical protein
MKNLHLYMSDSAIYYVLSVLSIIGPYGTLKGMNQTGMLAAARAQFIVLCWLAV